MQKTSICSRPGVPCSEIDEITHNAYLGVKRTGRDAKVMAVLRSVNPPALYAGGIQHKPAQVVRVRKHER